MGVSRTVTQSPKGYDLANLTAAKLGVRLAAGANATLRGNIRTAIQDGGYLFSIAPWETAAGLTNADLTFGYETWDFRRFASSFTPALAACAGRRLWIPNGAYNLTTGANGITVPDGTSIVGESRDGVALTYPRVVNGGVAINVAAGTGQCLSNFTLHTDAHPDHYAIQWNGTSRHQRADNVHVIGDQSAANTGGAFTFDGGAATTAFSGNFIGRQLYSLGFKFGISFVGYADGGAGNRTWTSCSFRDCYILGRAAGIIGGSRGIQMNALHNGVGSHFKGGTVEGYALGIQHSSGGFGIDYEADLEGNTAQYSVGATFGGRIITPNGDLYHAASNAALNRWYAHQHLNGVLTTESYYDQRHVIYDGSAAPQLWGLFRGASYFDAGTPTEKFAVSLGTSGDASVENNFWRFRGTQTQSWGAAAPATGTWARGSIVWNTAAAASGKAGFICTAGGTPGTWKPFGAIDP